MDYQLLGRNVRYYRVKQGLTQERLSEVVDVSTSFIGHIERGSRKPSMETVVKICEALQVNLSSIIPSKLPEDFTLNLSPQDAYKLKELLSLMIKVLER